LNITEFGDATRLDADPLLFWKRMEPTWPRLSRVAQRFLAIPASSAEVERMGSTAGRVLTARRSALKKQKAEMLIFLAHNKSWVTALLQQ